MDVLQEYNRWLSWPGMDAETKTALSAMTREQVEDAFYRDLAFGTGGLRGVIGAGTPAAHAGAALQSGGSPGASVPLPVF